MRVDPQDKKRSIIPRWRDFETTLALGELASAGDRISPAPIVPPNALDANIRDWRQDRILAQATDLIGAAVVLGVAEDIDDAVEFILGADSGATKLQRSVARYAADMDLTSTVATPRLPEVGMDSDQIVKLSKENVRRHRERLRISLNNPIRLVELAREFAVLGAQKKAVRTMEIAVGLAPANRFVLRSAVRLFVHANQKQRAHEILRRAPSLRFDPWLLSAEIALASMRDLTSANVAKGVSWSVDRDFNPFDISELAGAVATVEIKHGKLKSARKLFRRSLERPTDNSIAQVEWATRQFVEVNIDTGDSVVANNFEAPAWTYYSRGDLTDALELGKSWMLDQPFAATPVTFAGMVANLLDNVRLAQDFYSFGLRANPDDAILRNNLAFTLASDNRPDDAQVELDRIHRSTLKPHERIAITATEGLIRFRSGKPAEGRKLYLDAIRLAKEDDNSTSALRALVFLTREEINCMSAERVAYFERVTEEAKKFRPNTEMTMMMDKLLKAIQASSAEPIVRNRIALK